jgi:hypothetical protein
MKKNKTSPSRRLLTGTALAGLALNAIAGTDQAVSTTAPDQAAQPAQPTVAPAATFQKPAWLTDLSVGVKETYDDNVLLVSGDGPMKPQPSAVTTTTGKFGFNFAPLIGSDSIFDKLTLVYAPEVDLYHNAPDESFDAHRVTDTISGKADAFSYSLDNAFSFVDGSDTAPTYLGDDRYRSGFASVVPKERRKQIQDRMKAVLQYDWNSFFFRPTASLLDYDMMTTLKSTEGYQNYPSRADINGGADFGYRLTPDVAVTVGYRYGHQYQQQLPSAIDSTQLASGSDYQRALLGIEGKPWHWLELSMQGGPDFRNYDATAGVADKNEVTYYAEASATATITPEDSLSFKYKQWRWVAYTGRLPYFDSNYELTYHRKLTNRLSFDLTGRIASYDFTCASDPIKEANQRNDYLYSIAPGLTFAVTHNLSITASGSIDFGHNAQDNAPGGADYREFQHDVASIGATYKF